MLPRLILQLLVQAKIKVNISGPHNWSFARETHRWPMTIMRNVVRYHDVIICHSTNNDCGKYIYEFNVFVYHLILISTPNRHPYIPWMLPYGIHSEFSYPHYTLIECMHGRSNANWPHYIMVPRAPSMPTNCCQWWIWLKSMEALNEISGKCTNITYLQMIHQWPNFIKIVDKLHLKGSMTSLLNGYISKIYEVFFSWYGKRIRWFVILIPWFESLRPSSVSELGYHWLGNTMLQSRRQAIYTTNSE